MIYAPRYHALLYEVWIVLAFFDNHIWEVKTVFYLVFLKNSLNSSSLKFEVCLDALVNNFHIRSNFGIESFYEMSNIIWVLPAFVLLVKA